MKKQAEFLLKLNGLYSSMWDSQQNENDDETSTNINNNSNNNIHFENSAANEQQCL